MEQREKFGSRLGFILISAGCAIGLGNVWRFPYITGEYGGAAFVLMYIVFLIAFSLPILVMEFAVGRGSQKSAARAYDVLEPKGAKWHWVKWLSLAGNMLLMMFYTVVAGWMLAYMYRSASGAFEGLSPEAIGGMFDALLLNPGELVFWMLWVIIIGLACCAAGVQKGVERVTKVMMLCLLGVLVLLCVRAVTLEGAGEGLAFYLVPDFGKLFAGDTFADQMASFGSAAYAAMGQSFFTMSIGVGSMLIFGSYIGKERSLTGEALRVGALDTFVALMAGLIIFPACAAFAVDPSAGPGLVFVTLPSVFQQMPLGQLWCTLFFLFMSFAALSTIIAVFENIIAFIMDEWGITRGKSTLICGGLLIVLSLPCALGFNVWSDFTIPGIDGGKPGNIQALEDFVLSNNILPIGSLIILLFCTSKKGWGWDNFLAEADSGKGAKFPKWARVYVKYAIPVLIIVVLVMGWMPVVSAWMAPPVV